VNWHALFRLLPIGSTAPRAARARLRAAPPAHLGPRHSPGLYLPLVWRFFRYPAGANIAYSDARRGAPAGATFMAGLLSPFAYSTTARQQARTSLDAAGVVHSIPPPGTASCVVEHPAAPRSKLCLLLESVLAKWDTRFTPTLPPSSHFHAPSTIQHRNCCVLGCKTPFYISYINRQAWARHYHHPTVVDMGGTWCHQAQDSAPRPASSPTRVHCDVI